ncbi:MAG: sigma-70 family RNA polymerase sigma factor [Rhodothalassiaceae bacterium]
MREDEKNALEQLVRTRNDRMIRQAVRRSVSREDAEDLAQDAYLRVLSRDSLEPVTNLPAFLGRSMRNLAIDLVRRRSRRGDYETSAEEDRTLETHAATGDPERTAIAREQLARIRDAINALPPRCRQAFILHRFHGHDYAEIARMLGVSTSSVEKYIIRALEACRKQAL